MADAWNRGTRDASNRSPLQGGERRVRGENRDDRRERSIRVGVGHPSGDPARHRVFEVRAAFDEEEGGWVARVGEENPNEQLDRGEAGRTLGDRARAFPTPATCLGEAVAVLVAMVDREESGAA